MEILFPSGLIVEARKFNLGDVDEAIGALKDEIDADKRKRGGSLPLSAKMLDVVCGSVIESGPYDFEIGKKARWGEVAFPDIVVGNLIVRRSTRAELLVTAPCPACNDLGEDGVRSVDLEAVEIYDMSTEGIESIRSGAPIVKTFESRDEPGLVVEFKLKALLAKDINKMAQLQTQEEKKSLSIQTCFYIAGLKEAGQEELTALVDIRKRYETLPWDAMEFIDAEIDEAFGGFDPTYTFRCDKMMCNRTGEGKISMDPTFYGLGSRKPRKRQSRR